MYIDRFKNNSSVPVYMFLLVSVLLALPLTSCTTSKQSSMTDVAVSPLNDLNLMQTEIPVILLAAKKAPYVLPSNQNCLSLELNIRALDEVLGPDIDVVSTDVDSVLDKGADVVEDTAIGSMRRTIEGVVPFRGWVRKLSGAERYSRQVATALTAGNVRRAFLKGLRVSKACQ